MEAIALLSTYFQYLVGIAIGVITYRIVVIIRKDTQSFGDGGMGLKATLEKVSIHIKAIVICTLLECIVELIKSYYF